MTQRRRYSAEFKAKVALEAIRGQRTANEIASVHGVHPVQVAQWKKQALDELAQVFADRRTKAAQDEEALRAELYQQIGQLKVELDWVKKTSGALPQPDEMYRGRRGLVGQQKASGCRPKQDRLTCPIRTVERSIGPEGPCCNQRLP